ncbi:MAG TPA: hypothetical protein PK159_08710 [Steroidobacteraceae bacterium]|nr:hypothetical protein [Steroidobacteraceae bacterium]
MLQNSTPLSRPLLIGEVLDAGVRLFRASLLRSLPLSAPLVIASQLPAFYDSLQGSLSVSLAQKGPLWWLIYGLVAAVGAWMAGAMLLRQSTAGRAAENALGPLLLATLARVPGAVVISIIVSALLLAPLLLTLVGVSSPFVLIVITLTAWWLFGRLALAVPLYWCDGLQLVAALRSSYLLVRGNLWRLTAIVIVALTVLLVYFFMLAMLSAVVAPLLGLGDIAVIGALQAVVAVVAGAIGTPFATALALVVLQDFKRRRMDLSVAE